MRVVVVGATGNIGTSLVEALGATPEVSSVLGLARRRPTWSPPKTEWAVADMAQDDLVPLFRGADAVVHLAWLFQPSHHPLATWDVNVGGSLRVLEAVAEARVPTLVFASSVGAYSPAPGADMVDESWPTHGWPLAGYTREKAYLERVLDTFELRNPDRRVVRMRPAFCFKRESAPEQRRLFAGPLLPGRLVQPGRVPLVPDLPGFRFQAMHSSDAAEAYRLALVRDVRGAFNLAADPVIGAAQLAELMQARRTVRMPARVARSGMAALWHLRLSPSSPYLFEAALRMPVMDASKARRELGWSPRHDAMEALREFFDGLRNGSDLPTPPLARHAGGRLRQREVVTGVGGRTT